MISSTLYQILPVRQILILLYNNPMLSSTRLPREYFAQHTVDLARDLLGKRLVRLDLGGRDWLGSSWKRRPTAARRTGLSCQSRADPSHQGDVRSSRACLRILHLWHALDVELCQRTGWLPAAVLIRAIWPTEGILVIASRRSGRPRSAWTDGPAKLCQALGN
jgi:DNA-3-methyladenine glycosylase